MSEQNNTSFAHAFLPGLILGLIVGAVAGAFVPDMMSSNHIKIDPAHAATHDRTEREGVVDDAMDHAEHMADDMKEGAEDLVDDAEEVIDDTTNTQHSQP